MSDPQPTSNESFATSDSAPHQLPEQLAADIRKLSHDLSNSLEIIVQTSYLLGTAGLTEPASDWLRMLEDGVNRSLDLNNSLRTYIRDHSDREKHLGEET